MARREDVGEAESARPPNDVERRSRPEIPSEPIPISRLYVPLPAVLALAVFLVGVTGAGAWWLASKFDGVDKAMNRLQGQVNRLEEQHAEE